MTLRKSDNLLRGDRTPVYVGRETGAAELEISPGTWDEWVKGGRLPPPCNTFPEGTPRWRWEDVDRRLSAQKASTGTSDAAMAGALNFGKHVRKKRRGFCMTPRHNSQPIAIESLERSLLKLAYIVNRYGDAYLPLYERIERELAELKRVQALRERARTYLESNRHRLAELGPEARH